jgi:hypothetical protein
MLKKKDSGKDRKGDFSMKKILIVAIIGVLLAVAVVSCGRLGCEGDGRCEVDINTSDDKFIIHVDGCDDDDCAAAAAFTFSGKSSGKCDC